MGGRITGGTHAIPYIEFQGAQWFWNSLNSLHSSGFFLVLEMYLKKIHFFRLVLELLLNSGSFTINALGYNISVCPCLDLLFRIKYNFNSAQGNLNNRPGHQVTVGPNWNWMSFSKLPYLLDAL